MKVALDTNTLAYAEGVNPDSDLDVPARALLAEIGHNNIVVPVQVVGELFRVLVRKARRTPAEAKAAVEIWLTGYQGIETTRTAVDAALALAAASAGAG